MCLPLVAMGAAGAGVWTAFGRPGGPVGRALRVLPRKLRELMVEPDARLGAATRAAGAGAAVLVGGGALLLAVSLVWHSHAAGEAFLRLTEGWSGRLAVLLLCLTLVPNAAVWAAAYALGPGFVLGAGHVVAPTASAPAPLLPPFFSAGGGVGRGARNAAALGGRGGAVAGGGGGGVVHGAGGHGGRAEGAGSGPGRRGVVVAAAAAAAVVAAVLCAVLVALLAAFAGGPLGSAALARFGPVWWQAGGATLAWTGVVAVPVAVAARAWRGRSAAAREAVVEASGAEEAADGAGRRRRWVRVPAPSVGRWWRRGATKDAEAGAGAGAGVDGDVDAVPFGLYDGDGGGAYDLLPADGPGQSSPRGGQ
ncbi:integral membrane protein [Streptomyces lividans TK24]|nr:integral membrane protein [Streptomyces lividans TK24]